MEKNFGRRPVKGGPARQGPKIDANATTRGVQGSRGPLVGGRRIETAGPLVLSVTKEQEFPPQVLMFFVISSTISLRCRSLPIFFSIVLMEYTTVE